MAEEISENIERIIEPLDRIADTAIPNDNNLVISELDKTTVEDLADVISMPIDRIGDIPRVIDTSRLEPRDAARVLTEERRRRELLDEKRVQLASALDGELKRRDIYDQELETMKLEFEIYLKNKYPEFVGERVIKDNEVAQVSQRVSTRKAKIKEEKKKLQKEKIERLTTAKLRESRQTNLGTTPPTSEKFFEDDILLEQKDKLAKNPQLQGLDDVQKLINEVEKLEATKQRPIIPHRDILENNFTEQDLGFEVSEDDIFINMQSITPSEEDTMLEKRLRNLRDEINGTTLDEEFYIDQI